MPINESTRKPKRERWPLWMDIEGVPRDNAVREKILADQKLIEALEEQEPSMKSQNSFTVDKPVVITDINNPPHKNYNPNDPKNEFPKMVYHHGNGRVLTVHNKQEEAAVLKRGFDLKPSAGHDYSQLRGGVAKPVTIEAKREEEMSAEELAALDEAELAGTEAEQAPVQEAAPVEENEAGFGGRRGRRG